LTDCGREIQTFGLFAASNNGWRLMPLTEGQAGRHEGKVTPGFAVSAAIARVMYGPRLVIPGHHVEGLLLRQVLVNVDCDNRIADGERRAVV